MIESKYYTYDLPEEKIAQRPVTPYDVAKLLIVKPGGLEETSFSDVGSFLNEQDLLVLNNTAVFPARLFGVLDNASATPSHVEVLLVRSVAEDTWDAIGRPLKKFKDGTVLKFTDDLSAEVLERNEDQVRLRFSSSIGSNLTDLLDQAACMPIPYYIRKGHADEVDRKDYQTCFAKHVGAIAAPTASLHFTEGLFKELQQKVSIEYVTLHIGMHSFQPLWREASEEIRPPGEEKYQALPEVWEKIIQHKRNGGRVVAVGTSVVRALESAAAKEPDASFHPTQLMIKPGYEFKVVDRMITNFHQPASSHLLLMEAFLGSELLAESYEYALAKNFRFLSYGDAMLCF